MIELQAPSASGKSHLLHELIVACLLPRDLRISSSVSLPSNKVAVVYDTDGTFDVRRLAVVLRRCLESRLPLRMRDPDLTTNAVTHILSLVHIFRPSSSLQLATNLRALPAWHTLNAPTSEITLVAIDSMSAYYWPDRFTAEQMRSYTSSGPVDAGSTHPSPSALNPLHHILTSLEALRVSHAPVVILTNWGLNPLKTPPLSSEPQLFKQHLHPFPTVSSQLTIPEGYPPLSHHITLQASRVAQSQPSPPSLVIAESENTQSKTVVEISGMVRSRGADKTGRFCFTVDV